MLLVPATSTYTSCLTTALSKVMRQQDWRNSDLCCLIQALASAASTFFPGRANWKARSRALFENDTDFLSHCMVSLSAFVMSNGLLVLRLLKSLVDSRGLKSKESNPSCTRNSFFTTKIIIPIMWSATALNFT